ncbi:hypothetical protein [Flavobacterium tistrianum]|uniref:hypothetical protein n=1 Tax=Flavobacterium tistrianum TaxID=1685414 RepID=UPI000DADA0B8|nr:hypothetical protein [Flavobacterium tistrianum]KAF2342536.1 hypothetical protein DMB71_03700 [Flavobacterium tistrianum]
MKKLIALFLVLTALSCSSEDQVNQEVSSVENSASVLDGKMLSFKNEESFVKEYSDLALLSNDELKKWISSKKLESLLNTSDNSEGIEEDVVPATRLVYSDALKAILNSDLKVKVDGKVIWLNERTFYLLSEDDANKSSNELVAQKDKLKVYGSLLSLSNPIANSTAKNLIPNENGIRTFASEEMNYSGSRLRHVVDLFNETVYLNDRLQSSKMFIRSILQYRSCSTWRCTWKEAGNARNLTSDFSASPASIAWSTPHIYTYTAISGTQTILLSSWSQPPAPTSPNLWYPNFAISGPLVCTLVAVAPAPSVSINLSWY